LNTDEVVIFAERLSTWKKWDKIKSLGVGKVGMPPLFIARNTFCSKPQEQFTVRPRARTGS
jgi:hypothetical protein